MIKCLTAAGLATEASALDLVDGKAAAALLSEIDRHRYREGDRIDALRSRVVRHVGSRWAELSPQLARLAPRSGASRVARAFLVCVLPPLPRCSGWGRPRSSHPAVTAFPENVVGSACTSSFSRIAQRSLALRPAHSRGHLYVTSYTEGFSHFVTSMTAPVASGWSGCRVGLAPTGKRRLLTAHTKRSFQIAAVG